MANKPINNKQECLPYYSLLWLAVTMISSVSPAYCGTKVEWFWSERPHCTPIIPWGRGEVLQALNACALGRTLCLLWKILYVYQELQIPGWIWLTIKLYNYWFCMFHFLQEIRKKVAPLLKSFQAEVIII